MVVNLKKQVGKVGAYFAHRNNRLLLELFLDRLVIRLAVVEFVFGKHEKSISVKALEAVH